MVKTPSKAAVWAGEDQVLSLPMIKVALDIWVLRDAYAKPLTHSPFIQHTLTGGLLRVRLQAGGRRHKD